MKNEVLIQLRGDRSQGEMAKEIGIPKSTYAMVENGHRFPRRELQMKLSRHFKRTVDELFFAQFDRVS
ncbi:helix-turn-helix transcriptional regulator [Paenibacillus xylanexedens]|uniref:helix-turn-helix transcriptional regulator n=1 Tax=Paenibacillus xylanexedens TaxID=528191 RepID=UPI0011A655F9|nr:helix-turn-helix domain-containing protein [Paenibacillus xylanexedens]